MQLASLVWLRAFAARNFAAGAWSSVATCVGRLNIHGGATPIWLSRLLDPRSGALRRIERIDRAKSAAKRLLGDTAYRRLWSLVNREEPESADGGAPAS